MRSWRFILPLAVVLTAITGCIPGPGGSDSAVEATLTLVALSTEVQATLVAADTSTAPTSPSSIPTETPPVEPTEVEPAMTDTPPASPTGVDPIARLTQNTNCRAGASTQFKVVYIALIGEELKIVATTTLSDYVVVEVPGKPGQTCWLWTRYAELLGDRSHLPVSTPPPTPTPAADFNVTFDYVDSCVGWDPSLKVVNTGNVTFHSYYVTVFDTVESMSQEHTADHFDKTGGCPIVQSIPQLDPGATGWVYAYSFPFNPAGHAMEATVKLCTQPGLGGSCMSKSVNFTP